MKNIVAIVGGMGNQMFQYAYSLTLNPTEKVILNDYLAQSGYSNHGAALSSFESIKTSHQFLTNYLLWFVRKCIVFLYKKEFAAITGMLIRGMRFTGIGIITDYDTKNIVNKQGGRFINVHYGRFQSENSFVAKKAQVRKAFSFDVTKASDQTQQLRAVLIKENSVSIHIRRGDYLTSGNPSIFGNICTPGYYKNAIQHILNNVDNPRFYVFSDDIPWTKENLNLPNAFYVDWNQGVNSWEDMLLMSNCKHNIIANSTFSWWGAWLNSNGNKIILRPPRYTNSDDTADFYPEAWCKIEK